MTNNLVASISEFSSPEFIVKLATASGLDRSMAAKAVSAAVPTILSSLADLVTKPGGARKLMSAVAEQSADRESFSSNLLGPAQCAAAGNSVLSYLLGGAAPNLLASSIAGMLGANSTAMRTVLGMVTPRVLSGLSRFQRAQGLDADGLARMLVAQESNIVDAIPAGLPSYFRDNDNADMASTQRPLVPPRVFRVVSNQATKVRHVNDAEKGVPWPHWALAIAALVTLLWVLIPSQEYGQREAAAVSNHPIQRVFLLPSPSDKIAYITQPDQHWKSIGSSRNEYVNRVIHNARGETLGNVRDLQVGPDGKPEAAIISVGRYLGIGDKIVAVPFSALRLERHDGVNRVVIDLAKDALQSAPQYEEATTRER